MGRIKEALAKVRPFLPWLSLGTGIGGAVLMHRTPERAWLVVVASIAGWVALVVFNLAERAWSRADKTVTKRGARFALLLSNQMAMQQALLFPLPFYVKAANLPHVQLGHVVFFLVYAGALAVVMWDPLFERAMSSVAAAFALQAFAVFVGLDMVLPVLGLSNGVALVVAGAATGIGVPLLVLLLRPRSSTVVRDRVVAVSGAVVVVVLLRLAAPLVPPAPLELKSVAVGTNVEHRELVGSGGAFDHPAALYCHSAIAAPLGLKDALVHVWKRDGKPYDAVTLDVRGGRQAGFRTWSRETAPKPGRYRCTVETSSGQVLGGVSVDVRD